MHTLTTFPLFLFDMILNLCTIHKIKSISTWNGKRTQLPETKVSLKFFTNNSCMMLITTRYLRTLFFYIMCVRDGISSNIVIPVSLTRPPRVSVSPNETDLATKTPRTSNCHPRPQSDGHMSGTRLMNGRNKESKEKRFYVHCQEIENTNNILNLHNWIHLVNLVTNCVLFASHL